MTRGLSYAAGRWGLWVWPRGEGTPVPTKNSVRCSAPARSWQPPTVCRHLSDSVRMWSPLALGAEPQHSQPLERLQGNPRAPLCPLPDVSVGVRAVDVPPCTSWAVFLARRVVMGNQGTFAIGLGMSWNCWEVKPEAGGCPVTRASAGS